MYVQRFNDKNILMKKLFQFVSLPQNIKAHPYFIRA